MNKIKAAAAILLLLFTAAPSVQVYAAPDGMRYEIETIELKTDEIPADRVISLAVSCEGLPPFTKLRVLMQKDAALEFEEYCGTLNPDISRDCGMSMMFSPEVDANFVACNIGVLGEEPLDYNGELFQLNLILPENCQPGDYFAVKILSTFTSNLEYDTMVRDDDVRYGKGSFSELKSGGIRIRQDGVQTPLPVQQEEPQPEPPADSRNSNEEPAQADETPEETTAAVSADAAGTTVTTSETTAAETTQTTADITTVKQTETGTTDASVTETTPLPDADSSASEKKNRSAMIAVFLGIIAAGSGSGTVISRKRKQQK